MVVKYRNIDKLILIEKRNTNQYDNVYYSFLSRLKDTDLKCLQVFNTQ